VVKAESQAVLNTLIECNLQDEFKNWQKPWEFRILMEEYYFEGDCGSKLILTRWHYQAQKLWIGVV
jgi:hypothetical protein